MTTSIDKKGIFDRIRYMFLIRRLVIYLEKKNDNGENFTREEFVDFICNKKWLRWNYFGFGDKGGHKFWQMVGKVLGDNIGSDPNRHFIDYADDRKSLRVTARGRKLTTLLGFIQINGKEYSVIWSLATGVIGFGLGLIVKNLFGL